MIPLLLNDGINNLAFHQPTMMPSTLPIMHFLLFLFLASPACASFTAKWCNKYFCLDASLPAQPNAEITYALAARTHDMPGWLAIGTGYEMNGSKMWIVWPDQVGGCVLSERDGVSLFESR